MTSTIPTRSRAQKAKRTRARKSNPLREKKLVAQREVPAATDWETLRPEIHAKTEGECYLCGAWLSESAMTTDHVTIQKMGQKKNDDFVNLFPACGLCNFRKGSRRLTDQACPDCGQKYLVKGLPCLRCERLGTDVRRTMRTTI